MLLTMYLTKSSTTTSILFIQDLASESIRNDPGGWKHYNSSSQEHITKAFQERQTHYKCIEVEWFYLKDYYIFFSICLYIYKQILVYIYIQTHTQTYPTGSEPARRVRPFSWPPPDSTPTD